MRGPPIIWPSGIGAEQDTRRAENRLGALQHFHQGEGYGLRRQPAI